MRKRGFTLVEIIIGAFILGIATLGIYRAMASYMELTRTQTEVQRMERLKRAMNLDLMNGILPDNSNFNNLLNKWLGENTHANNYSNPYYLILPSGLSLGQDQNLCALVDNLNAVFRIRMPNGEVIDNVIYLLVSPTGKGENTIQRNGLPSNSSVIRVSSGATINISEYDIVRYMTKDSYKSVCMELAKRNRGDCEEALESAGFHPVAMPATNRRIDNWNNVVQACSGRNAYLYFDVGGGSYPNAPGGRTIVRVPISRLNSSFLEIIPRAGEGGYTYTYTYLRYCTPVDGGCIYDTAIRYCGGDYSSVSIRTSSGTQLLVVAAGGGETGVGLAGNNPGSGQLVGRGCGEARSGYFSSWNYDNSSNALGGGYGRHRDGRPGSYVNLSLAEIVFARDGGNPSLNGYVNVWYSIED